MGVPSYFFWLVKKFEEQILKEIEFKVLNVKDRPDNLFLDWNCGIHPAIKKTGLDTLEQKIQAVLDYLDKIYDLVLPSKLFYIAIDGVAPRAKMQQQRKRRFKSVQDAMYVKKLKEKYSLLDDDKEGSVEWDYNMISPGTIFMDELSKRIKDFLANNAKYRNVKIIVSDSSIPGEGEHKIMKYIRDETSMSEKNLIYGLDSDLIFLSLINFRPGLSLLREKVEFGDKFKINVEENQNKSDNDNNNDNDNSNSNSNSNNDNDNDNRSRQEWVLMSIDSLREIFLQIFNPYLSLKELENFNIFSSKALDKCNELFYKHDDYQTHVEQMLKERFYHDPEVDGSAIIIDYIFISFMLGNDFLPPIVSLQIKEGGLDHLIRAYKMTLILMKQNLIILETRAPQNSSDKNLLSINSGSTIKKHFRINTPFFIKLLEICTSFETHLLKQAQRNKSYRIANFKKSKRWQTANAFEKDMLDLDYVEDKVPDYIQLGEEGWASRYYDVHFHLHDRNEYESKKYIMGICDHYMRGMIWTLQYYLTGQSDWTWEYPFHSSPTIHDFLTYVRSPTLNNSYKIYKELTIKQERENEVTPLEQLMCILPPNSAHLLPIPIQEAMKSDLLAVYYPCDFSLDIFGHRYRWESHPLLPTIPAKIIKDVVTSALPYLTDEEIQRNSIKPLFLLRACR